MRANSEHGNPADEFPPPDSVAPSNQPRKAATDNSSRARRQSQAYVNQQARRNQYMYAFAAFAVISAMLLLFVFTSSGSKVLPDLATPNVEVPSKRINTSALWRESAELDISRLKEKEKAVSSHITQLQERVETVVASLEQQLISNQEQELEKELLALAAASEYQSEQSFQAQAQASFDEAPYQEQSLRQVNGTEEILVVKVSAPLAEQELEQGQIEGGSVGIEELDLPQRSKRADPASYIPGGSFMQAVILGGIDAPTGEVSRDNPHPVLLRVSDEARLPNLARKDLRECLVLAAGYGDIASERALLRTERMSCRLPSGDFFDHPIRGFIVGEDGRAGVRGKLVTKQGQILRRSMIAGFGAAFGDILQQRFSFNLQPGINTTITDSTPNAVTVDNTPGLSEYTQAGLAGGASNALDRLSDYYIRLADQVHPIIEIGAGRTVDIVLQEGIDLSLPLAAQ